AQLGERYNRTVEVGGSSPPASTPSLLQDLIKPTYDYTCHFITTDSGASRNLLDEFLRVTQPAWLEYCGAYNYRAKLPGRQVIMQRFQVRLIGRRSDQPQTIVLRDEEGRYFLRSACGSRPVRITARDAERLMLQYRYAPVEDDDWHPSTGISDLGCPLPELSTDYDQVSVS
ncbi:MAG: hypothetical protein WD401_00350, partial [Thermomicrobiaceae bacterium]